MYQYWTTHSTKIEMTAHGMVFFQHNNNTKRPHKKSTMVASAVFITDLQGKAIISRNYRGDVPLTKAIERFSKYLVDVEDESKRPVFHVDSNGDVELDEVGGSGPGGETFVYIAVSTFPTHVSISPQNFGEWMPTSQIYCSTTCC
jgi:hypothetical protein